MCLFAWLVACLFVFSFVLPLFQLHCLEEVTCGPVARLGGCLTCLVGWLVTRLDSCLFVWLLVLFSLFVVFWLFDLLLGRSCDSGSCVLDLLVKLIAWLVLMSLFVGLFVCLFVGVHYVSSFGVLRMFALLAL